jgi:hypothetical protein
VTAASRRALLLLAAATAASGLAPAAWAEGQPVQLDDPPPGKALIVFFRKWEYPDSAISYIVREGKAELGRLSAGSYFTAAVDPGLHTYTVHAERRNDMQIVAEAGETYYVRFELDIGVVLYQPTLVPAEQRLFDAISARLSRSEPLAPAGVAAPAAP